MMRFLGSLSFFVLLTACASMVIRPVPQTNSQIDTNGQRIVQTVKGVELAAKLHEISVRPSPAQQNYCSFWVEVSNRRNVLLPLSYSDFLLIDAQGRQYQAADPAELVETLTDTSAYLIPYPYVGFYYLEDSIRSQQNTQFRSEKSYFSSRRPEYLKMEAIQSVDVLPAAKVVGAIYFPAELRTMTGFQLRYQLGALPGQKPYQMSLPFAVEKK